MLIIYITLATACLLQMARETEGNPRRPIEFIVQPPYLEEPEYSILYQTGKREEDLPECAPWSVCNKVDTYEKPWIERQCRCPKSRTCSMDLDKTDGHTIYDRNRQYKLCEHTRRLPRCNFFKDVAWTIVTSATNVTRQTVHCHCPKSGVAYLTNRLAFQTPDGIANQYQFSCSPHIELPCARKAPCRLFTIQKRHGVIEANINTLCQCPFGQQCPEHHKDTGSIVSQPNHEHNLRTYSGFCV